uniref:Uncharacterized protein n=1 Tax=Myoviridae sp. ctGBP5 TaxID=2825071 RepID=A0A8S5PBK2_9CAUD|nr:MAG TPA: hypothetical protein [Myoviridae sp. ctGBP5]
MLIIFGRCDVKRPSDGKGLNPYLLTAWDDFLKQVTEWQKNDF